MAVLAKREDGFGAAGVLIVIVVIALVALSGWYVAQNNNKTDKNKAASTQSTDSSKAKDAYADWQSYAKNSLDFKYPADWTLEDSDAEPQVKSADYASTGVQSVTVTKGASIGVYSFTAGAGQAAITAANFKQSTAWNAANTGFQSITVNGKKAVQYKIAPDITEAVLFGADGASRVKVQFQYATSSYDQEVGIYTYLLETVKTD